MSAENRINRRLVELGWSDRQLADVAGVSQSYVNRVKNGHQEPRVGTAIALAQALQLSVEALFTEATA